MQYARPHRAALRAFVQKVIDDHLGLPPQERETCYSVSSQTLDLSCSRFFLMTPTLQHELVTLVGSAAGTTVVKVGGRDLYLHVALRVMLDSLSSIHSFCRQKTPLLTKN